jgi:hypothetical protein
VTNVVRYPPDASAILGARREGRLCGSRVSQVVCSDAGREDRGDLGEAFEGVRPEA